MPPAQDPAPPSRLAYDSDLTHKCRSAYLTLLPLHLLILLLHCLLLLQVALLPLPHCLLLLQVAVLLHYLLLL